MLLLEREGVAFSVHSYDPPRGAGGGGGGYGAAGALALGVDAARMLKTLIADLDGDLVCAVLPVAGPLDLKALAAALAGRRAALADPARAERSSGYVVGGISPLGQRTRLRTVLDERALLQETVLVSAGRRGMCLELAPADLQRLTGARWAELSR